MIATSPTKGASLLQSAGGILRLIRPLNLLILLIAVGAGAVLATEQGNWMIVLSPDVWLAALSAMLIGGAANSMNDYFDVEIDRINCPGRPLPSAVVSPGVARIVWAVGSALGLGISFWLSLPHAVLAVGAVVLLYLYNRYWKRTVLIGNVVVASMTALAVVYGALVVGLPDPVLAGAAFAALTTLAREIIKDVEDLEGDAEVEARTTAVAWGAHVSARVAANILGVTILLTPVPYLLLDFGDSYLLAVILADAVMLYAIWCLQVPHRSHSVRRASGAVKWAMVIGIVALTLATGV